MEKGEHGREAWLIKALASNEKESKRQLGGKKENKKNFKKTKKRNKKSKKTRRTNR